LEAAEVLDLEVAVEAREFWDSNFDNVWDLEVAVEDAEVRDLEVAEVWDLEVAKVWDLEVAEVLIVFALFVILPRTA